MKKNILVALVLVGNFVFGQFKKDVQVQNLKGKVKSITQKEALLVKKDGSFVKYLDSFMKDNVVKTSYNEQGEETEAVIYDRNGQEKSKINTQEVKENIKKTKQYRKSQSTLHLYDDKMQVVEIVSFDSNGKRKYSCKNDYDKKGNLTKERCYTVGDVYPFRTTKYFYNSKNKPAKHIGYNGKGKKIETAKYIYNEHNDIIGMEIGDVTIKSEYKYDAKGNWIENIRSLDDNNKILVERTIEYYD